MANMQEYLAGLLKDAGLAQPEQEALTKAFANEKVANAFVPRPDFSRALDEKDTAFKNLQSQTTDYYQKELERTRQNEEAVRKAQEAVQRYVATYGELPNDGSSNPGAARAAAAADSLSRKDLDEILAKRDGQTLFLMKQMGRIASRHAVKFGEELDTDALEKFAVEHQLPVNVAYDQWVAPRIAEKQNQDWDTKLKAAREEGLREGLSKAKVPIDSAPREPHPFFDRTPPDKAPATERDRLNSFSEAWETAIAAPTKP